MEKIYSCPKCGQIVSQDPEYVSEGYFGACLNCDEDYYCIELKEKIYNDDSKRFKDWTTQKLKDEATAYYDSIYKQECFNTRDLQMYDGICNELSTRGIEPQTKLYF